MSETKPLVLVVGGTGNTGIVILKALAQAGTWRLASSVRPTSIDKPEVALLKELGVEIRTSDWQTDSLQKLDELFAGANIVISTVSGSSFVIPDQKILVDAAKRANVNRFIPCDFGGACVPGVRDMYDQKLAIRDYTKEKGVPYTFVDIGAWMQGTLPYPAAITGVFADMLRTWYGDGNTKTAIVNLNNVGQFIARIIVDPRTLNQYVFIYDDEATMNEIYKVASSAAGEDFHKIKIPISNEEALKRVVDSKAASQQDPSDSMLYAIASAHQYIHSVYIAGLNTPEVARSQGALIGKELYPDMKFQSVAEFAKEFYGGSEKVYYQ